MGYLDGIIIFSNSEKEHLQHIADIYKKLCKVGLKLKLFKCVFFQKELQYLEHLVSKEGARPLPEKLESIKNMPAPRNTKEVKQFLALIGYYQKFIPQFSDIAHPLSKLTAKDQIFKWMDLCNEPILKYPGTSKLHTLKLDVMKDIYHLVIFNIKLARERMIKNQGLISKLDIKISDLVLV